MTHGFYVVRAIHRANNGKHKHKRLGLVYGLSVQVLDNGLAQPIGLERFEQVRNNEFVEFGDSPAAEPYRKIKGRIKPLEIKFLLPRHIPALIYKPTPAINLDPALRE